MPDLFTYIMQNSAPVTDHEGPRREQTFFNLCAEWGECLTLRPSRYTFGKEFRFPLHIMLGGPHGRSGWVRKAPTKPEFEPQTVQPVASRYTDYVAVTSDIDLTL
jgi:hypothetical protein